MPDRDGREARDGRTVRDLRRGNRSTLLRRLYFEGPLSRHDLSRDTGLSPASVSNVVAELLAAGVVTEAGFVESAGGRPRALLKVDPSYAYLVGVDVGETRVRVELFDLDLTELAKADHPLPPGGHPPEAVAGHVLVGLEAVVADSGVDPAAVAGVGVGVPGVVEQEAGGPGDGGALVHSQAFGWDAVPVERLLRAGTPLPLFIDNGATALAQAELWFGAGRGARDAVVALIGSGVGAGIIAGGAPFRGAAGGAGEWGHTVVRVGGRACRCGASGCLEAYVGAGAVLRRYAETASGEEDPGGAPPDQETALARLVEAAETSPRAREVLEEAAVYLGAGIAGLVNLLNPERIVIGGWAGLLLGPRLLPRIRAAAEADALRHPFARTSIDLCELGPDAVAMGAATLPLAHFLASGGTPAPRAPGPRRRMPKRPGALR